VAEKCFVPLTVAGGVRSVSDFIAVTRAGADKVAINSGAFADPTLIRAAADAFGSQCVVVSIDAVALSDGQYDTVTHAGAMRTGLDPVTAARRFEKEGAGELLLNAVHRDGSKQGYDLQLLKAVAQSVMIPVIACGGVGQPQHFGHAFEVPGVQAAAAANYFNFTEHSVLTAKGYLVRAGWDVRRDTNADYTDHLFEDDGRVAKQPDAALRALVYEYYPEEVI
jgi:cyclase